MHTINRESKRVPLNIYANKIVDHEPHLTRVRDISPEGVYLYRLLEPEIPTTKPIGLEIKLPETSNVIWAVGRVVRHDPDEHTNGVAVRFTHIAAADRKLIEDYIAQRDDSLEEPWVYAA